MAKQKDGDSLVPVRCPCCWEVFQHNGSSPEEIRCPSCGNRFSLVDNGKGTQNQPVIKKIGQFEVIELLGKGSFGAVWKAYDPELDRTIAIKTPRETHIDPKDADRFFREARAAAQLQHSNIVSVHEVGQTEDATGNTNLYIVSEIVRGVTLDQWASAENRKQQEVVSLCAKIADALDHAHNEGIIHRDLKPTNIMVDANNEPFVTDFGLAKRDSDDPTLTAKGQILGSMAYMSPEQARGESHQVDRRTDIYSLGVILYELLGKQLPFEGNGHVQKILETDVPPLRSLNRSTPRDLETICQKCMEYNRLRRYASAHEVAEELNAFQKGEPIIARRPTPSYIIGKWLGRNKLIISLAAIVGVVLMMVWQLTRVPQGNYATSFSDPELLPKERIEALENLDLQGHMEFFPYIVEAMEHCDNHDILIAGLNKLQETWISISKKPATRPIRKSIATLASALLEKKSVQPKALSLYLKVASEEDALGRIREIEDIQNNTINVIGEYVGDNFSRKKLHAKHRARHYHVLREFVWLCSGNTSNNSQIGILCVKQLDQIDPQTVIDYMVDIHEMDFRDPDENFIVLYAANSERMPELVSCAGQAVAKYQERPELVKVSFRQRALIQALGEIARVKEHSNTAASMATFNLLRKMFSQLKSGKKVNIQHLRTVLIANEYFGKERAASLHLLREVSQLRQSRENTPIIIDAVRFLGERCDQDSIKQLTDIASKNNSPKSLCQACVESLANIVKQKEVREDSREQVIKCFENLIYSKEHLITDVLNAAGKIAIQPSEMRIVFSQLSSENETCVSNAISVLMERIANSPSLVEKIMPVYLDWWSEQDLETTELVSMDWLLSLDLYYGKELSPKEVARNWLKKHGQNHTSPSRVEFLIKRLSPDAIVQPAQ